MEIFREGRLRNSDLATGNTLSLQLGTEDIKRLADPDQRYSMARFMQFKHFRLGWAAEDKVHVRLESPWPDQNPERVANLQLDPGGDLYFDIWDRQDLLTEAKPVEVFKDLDTFVTYDPSQVLNNLGIEIVRIYYLDILNLQIQNPDYL